MIRLPVAVAVLATAGCTGALRPPWDVPPVPSLQPHFVAVAAAGAPGGEAGTAQPSPGPRRSDPPPRADLVVDTAITAATGVTWLGLRLALPWIGRESCPCDRADVNEIDRPAVGWELPMGKELSNIAAALVIVVPAWAFWHTAPDAATFASDTLLVLEATMISGLATQIVKTSVGRPYPYMYRDPRPAQIDSGESYASFWSGHTAASVAAAVSFAYVFQQRRPDSPWRWVAWALGPLVGLSSGLLRMAEGDHFPTDIAVGAVFGAGVGLLVPWLHE